MARATRPRTFKVFSAMTAPSCSLFGSVVFRLSLLQFVFAVGLQVSPDFRARVAAGPPNRHLVNLRRFTDPHSDRQLTLTQITAPRFDFPFEHATTRLDGEQRPNGT